MGKVMIVYYSKSGNTRKMAELVAEGAKSVPGTEVLTAEAPAVDMDEFASCKGFAFGSPDYYTYMAGALKTVFDEALSVKEKIKGHPFVSFVSHGGGGGAIKSVDALGKAIGLKQLGEGVLSQGAPEKKAADACKKLGAQLAAAAK